MCLINIRFSNFVDDILYGSFMWQELLLVRCRMLRRNPTRIELKVDDIDKEYELMKREKELDLRKQTPLTETPSVSESSVLKSRTDIIHERIGYDPKPQPQPSRLPLH